MYKDLRIFLLAIYVVFSLLAKYLLRKKTFKEFDLLGTINRKTKTMLDKLEIV